MGISGLLPLLKDIQVQGNISAFKGQRLAVDAYVWLHKGAFGCAEDLVKGKKTTRFVDYAMYRVRLLRYHGITPFIVFDGGPLPAKKGTENSRAKSRAENLAKAASLESQGRSREARDVYTKCIDITPEMAYQLIKALRAENVEYIVAPYEADAQLCFLEREGLVDGIITEDSDLLVIFKLDGNGHCVWIHRDKLATVRDFPMHGWTDVQFRRMAMLSGCDYLPSIPGIGIKTAHRLLRRHKTVEKLLQAVQLDGALPVPPNYTASFAQAELAFIHQRVFDPISKRLVPLNDFPEGGLQDQDKAWIGLDMRVEIARGVARGDLHPETMLPIEDQWPDYKPVGRKAVVTSTSASKNVLGESSKVNVAAGPMDAFVSRSKKSRPPILAKPVGVFGSGPSRLSNQPCSSRPSRPRLAEPGDRSLDDEGIRARGSRPAKKSKFFSGSRMHSDSEQLEAVELVWEHSDDSRDVCLDEPVAGLSRHSRSPSLDENIRSPSPVVSSLRAESSPARTWPVTEGAHLSSPAGSAPLSPAFSSPPRGDSFSPESQRDRGRARSPVSSSRKKPQAEAAILIAPLSHGLQKTQSLPNSQIIPDHTPAKRDRQSRVMSRLSNVLVPGSSPSGAKIQAPAHPRGEPFDLRHVCRIGETPSDSIEEEMVVTPSAEVMARRQPEEETQEEQAERRREERAKVVAAGWCSKYAFVADTAFPSRCLIKKPQAKATISDSPRSWPTTRQQPVRAETTPRVLGERPVNVPLDSVVRRKSSPTSVYGKGRSPVSAFDPQNLSWSALEKYRFTGKVVMD